ncbi:ATP-dependent nuclease [Laspinema olomoucense]|uniref:AAA family ATPase n=1 Tax=Laspinema olomoucense D3b TaxID=2953688 RepID=A0ABT2NCN8_9CYAN|nr:AAA family ATPase [Laspinema sp. D3b]MCT7980449.1 AAA family ATPase [Laspinema sp. D3b]
MINKSLSFELPLPWQNKTFDTSRIGYINFLVGPNGSGKSKFGKTLKDYLGNARLLGTDRLRGMEQNDPLASYHGDYFSNGLAKTHFNQYKMAGQQGLGIDTIILLEERMDLRIQVEATLSHLFNRKIYIEWDSGNLLARAVLGDSGVSYRLDRDECHGIKELLVLLTHLYNNEYPYLIIDEPELNLHPQYQAFFIQEVRKLAGNPTLDPNKKIVFLVTHSPFILDFRTIEDVKSIISFSLDHSVPKHILDIDEKVSLRLSKVVPRINTHHKQLFFSDNPIFVEGILDAQFIASLQEARGVSVAGAGSCIIDAGGCEEVNRYVELCLLFGKKAHFLYDLDSLFSGNLRACVKDDETVQNFLAHAGVANDFAKYCGELDKKLTEAIDRLLHKPLQGQLSRLHQFLSDLGPKSDWDKKKNWGKARVAVLTALSLYRDEVANALKPVLETEGRKQTVIVEEIEGRLNQITTALRQKNIHLLSGGTLERYLPQYSGDRYDLKDDLKRQAVAEEIEQISAGVAETDLASRYGELFVVVCLLPSKIQVDVDRVLKDYLRRYIHELQVAVTNHQNWKLEQIQSHLNTVQSAAVKIFSIEDLQRNENNHFSAVIVISEMLGQERRLVRVSHQTNAGMDDFEITNYR